MFGSPLLRSVAALAVTLTPFTSASADETAKPTPLELFAERILPIFKSPEPSSCVQCHLSSVELKDYILPSHEETFVSLRDQGLIDLARPQDSKILRLIKTGDADPDEKSRLIHADMRKAEHEAFAAWIEACCVDPTLKDLPKADPTRRARPKQPDPVIRHARKSRVVDSFTRNVWSQRMRCFPYHTPFELDENNPKHRRPIEKVKQLAERIGGRAAERLRIFRKTPAATLQYLIEDSRQTPPGRLPLLNLDNPRKSLLVLKPTSRLPKKAGETREPPSYAEPVSHMGGLKMHQDDPSYKAFVAWLEDYAKVVSGRYRSVDELPSDNWYASKRVIVIRNVPDEWPKLARVQLFVYPWDGAKKAWAASPIAFTQNSVTPRRKVVGALFLLRPKESEGTTVWGQASRQLKPGKYLIKAHLDSQRRLADDPTAMLGQEDFYGQVSLQARWRKGFRTAEKIDGKLFRQAES